MLLLRIGLNAPPQTAGYPQLRILVNGLEILMDDYPLRKITTEGPVGRKQSALSLPQVILNEFENIGSPDIRPTPAETVTFLRAGTECRVSFGLHGFAGLPHFLTQDAVGR